MTGYIIKIRNTISAGAIKINALKLRFGDLIFSLFLSILSKKKLEK